MRKMKALLVVIALIATVKWIKWKVSTLALIYYNEQNQYKHPTNEEMKECIGFVVKNSIKDVTGR